jgi:hypothetical protein
MAMNSTWRPAEKEVVTVAGSTVIEVKEGEVLQLVSGAKTPMRSKAPSDER